MALIWAMWWASCHACSLTQPPGVSQPPVAGSGDRGASKLSPRKCLSYIPKRARADLNSLSSSAWSRNEPGTRLRGT